MPILASANQRKKNRLHAILGCLMRMYGPVTPPRSYRGAGLDNLIEAMLSQNTNGVNAARGYRMLRRRFSSWTKVMNAPRYEVQRQIAICGLARMRARRLQALLATIKQQRGALSIDFLADEPTDAAFDYLMSFHGIGPKTAAFTLLFAFAHPVLPVDNGILRVVRRLRLVRTKAQDLEAERILSPLIVRGSHYAMHVLLFRHAKQRCRPKNPKCDECALLKMCPHGQRVVKHRPKDADEELSMLLRRERRRTRLAKFISAGIRKDEDQD
jgi:endonuclease-3